jgi:predicted transcriptional regulator
MDTKKLVEELLATGLTQTQLAELVPCSQSLIAALVGGSRGKQTTFVIVDRLDKLHAERCVDKATA